MGANQSCNLAVPACPKVVLAQVPKMQCMRALCCDDPKSTVFWPRWGNFGPHLGQMTVLLWELVGSDLAVPACPKVVPAQVPKMRVHASSDL